MSQPTPFNSHFWKARLDSLLAVLVFGAVVWWLFDAYQAFGDENQQYAKGVCCGFTDALFDATLKLERGESVDFSKGYASYLGAEWWRWWNRQPSALLWLSQVSHLLTGIVVFAWGQFRKRPLVGLLGGVAVLLTPISVYASLRWDVYALQGPLIVLAWILVSSSKGFTAIVPTIGFAVIVWVSAFWSFRETDNLILLLTHASLAFGTWISALVSGKDHNEQSVHRGWSAVIAIGTCAVLLWQIALFWRFSSPEGLAYYFREADNPMIESTITLNASLRWFGYWGYFYWRAFGPALTIAIGTAVISLMLRKRIPWGLFLGVLIPYLALSWISKRNFYYPSSLWVLLPLILGEGVHSVDSLSFRRVFCVLGLGVSMWTFQQRLDKVELVGDDQYGGLFQTSDGHLSLEPTRFWGVEELSTTVQEYLPEHDCTKERIVVLEANAMIEEVALRLGQEHPCMQLKRQLQNREQRVLDTVQIWVIDPNHTRISTDFLTQQGLFFQTEVLMDNRFRLELWSR